MKRRPRVFEPSTIAVVTATFLIAGVVKGVIGLGLPTIGLAVLTVALDLPSAMALLLVPSFVTNLAQAVMGGDTRVILHRLWPFLAMATATVWLGATALKRVDWSVLSGFLGILLVVYAAVSLTGLRLSIPPRHERWAGPLLGTANGVLTGMTGSFVIPGVMFLQAIGLSRDALFQAMGMLFTVSTLALALALRQNDLLGAEHGMLSLLALFPALGGLIVGQRIRKRLPEALFRRVFFVALLLLGAYIVVAAFAAFG